MVLHVLTHPFPTRRSSVRMALRLERLGIWAVGCMFQQRPRKQQQVKPADQRHDKTHGRDLENAERRLARGAGHVVHQPVRSEEHASELQSLMRISYAVFCLKKK